MHVVLLHQAFVSPQEAGGTRHYEFARRCVDQGHQFSIVSSDLSYIDGKRVSRDKRLITRDRLQGIDILRAYTYPSLHRSFIWRVVSYVSFMLTSVMAAFQTENVDLVMGTSPPIFQAVSAWAAARIRRVPFLLEIRDLWPEFAIDMGVLKNPLIIKLSRWLENFLYRQANHIVVNSPAYRDYLIKKQIAQEKITLIPNGVDSTLFNPSINGKRFRQEFGLSDKFIVTYAGALGMANDIPTLLKAADSLRDLPLVQFLLVGDGKERNNLEEMAKRLKLPNVLFTGSRPKSEMPAILAASDVCTASLMDIPMFKTTYPNKVFDYMAAGRPTILAIDGVIREVVETANGGIFVSPGNSEALADAVKGLYADKNLCKEMGASAREYVIKNFDREDHSRQFISLIEKLGS